MAVVSFTIDNAVALRLRDALVGLYPIPQDAQGNPLFPQNDWAKECTRRWWKQQIRRWEQEQARVTAAQAVAEIADNLIS